MYFEISLAMSFWVSVFTTDSFILGCTEIESVQDLEKILGQIDTPYEKMCYYLGISKQACNELKNNKDFSTFTLAREYMEQFSEACWEEIVRRLCKDFSKGGIAHKVADEHSISLSKYCG